MHDFIEILKTYLILFSHKGRKSGVDVNFSEVSTIGLAGNGSTRLILLLKRGFTFKIPVTREFLVIYVESFNLKKRILTTYLIWYVSLELVVLLAYQKHPLCL